MIAKKISPSTWCQKPTMVRSPAIEVANKNLEKLYAQHVRTVDGLRQKEAKIMANLALLQKEMREAQCDGRFKSFSQNQKNRARSASRMDGHYKRGVKGEYDWLRKIVADKVAELVGVSFDRDGIMSSSRFPPVVLCRVVLAVIVADELKRLTREASACIVGSRNHSGVSTRLMMYRVGKDKPIWQAIPKMEPWTKSNVTLGEFVESVRAAVRAARESEA